MNNISAALTSPFAKEIGQTFVRSTIATAGTVTGLFAGSLAIQAVQKRVTFHAKPEEK